MWVKEEEKRKDFECGKTKRGDERFKRWSGKESDEIEDWIWWCLKVNGVGWG